MKTPRSKSTSKLKPKPKSASTSDTQGVPRSKKVIKAKVVSPKRKTAARATRKNTSPPSTKATASKSVSSPATQNAASKPKVKKKLAPKQGSSPKSASRTSLNTSKPQPVRRADRRKYLYDVCFSFAGEDRERVEKVKWRVEAKGVSVFYDADHQSQLWGKNLYDHLADLYQNKARFCVIFVSRHYIKKEWTKHERQSAQARALSSEEEYILPVSLDDTKLPALAATVGHIDLRKHSIYDLVRFIVEKVQATRRHRSQAAAPKTAEPISKVKNSKPKTIKRKTSTKKSGVNTAQNFVFKSKVKTSGKWILLNDEFYQFETVETQDGKVIARISPRNAEEEARLNDLDPQHQLYRQQGRISCAYHNRAFWVHVERIMTRITGRKIIYTLILKPEHTASMARFGGAWDGRNLEAHARRLLLNEDSSSVNSFANSHSLYDSKKRHSGIFPLIWQRLHGQPLSLGDALRCARLDAIFQLVTGGVVEHIYELTLGPATKGALGVYLRGRTLSSAFNGQAGGTIQVRGKTPLLESDS